MNRLPNSIVAGLSLMLVAGCGIDLIGLGDGQLVRTVGIIERDETTAGSEGMERHERGDDDVELIRQPEPLEAPDSVQRGVPFTVSVTTIGDGCTTPAGVELSSLGSLVEITAYDLQRGGLCPAPAVFLTRDVLLRFDSVGEVTIRLVGRRIENGEAQPERVRIEKQVTVH